MTPEQFAYWLQGYSEMNGLNGHPTVDQWRMIQEHLRTVFVKITPTYLPKSLAPSPMPGVGPVITNVPYLTPGAGTTICSGGNATPYGGGIGAFGGPGC